MCASASKARASPPRCGTSSTSARTGSPSSPPAAGSLKALIDKSQRPATGDRVAIAFNTARIVLFDAGTEQLLASATTRRHQEARRHGQH
jgi:hypothetical protein